MDDINKAAWIPFAAKLLSVQIVTLHSKSSHVRRTCLHFRLKKAGWMYSFSSSRTPTSLGRSWKCVPFSIQCFIVCSTGLNCDIQHINNTMIKASWLRQWHIHFFTAKATWQPHWTTTPVGIQFGRQMFYFCCATSGSPWPILDGIKRHQYHSQRTCPCMLSS